MTSHGAGNIAFMCTISAFSLVAVISVMLLGFTTLSLAILILSVFVGLLAATGAEKCVNIYVGKKEEALIKKQLRNKENNGT